MRAGTSGVRAFESFDLVVRRRLAGLLTGDHLGVGLGPGSEPEEVVRYRPGEDDVRRIDWNVTARSQEPHVWRPRAEHELDTWVLVDRTASMDFGTADVEKRDLAAWVTGAVGLLADGPGNRVGVGHLTSDGVQWKAMAPGRVAARRAIGELESAPRSVGPGADLATGLTALERRHRRPGLRVVITDFVESDGNSERPFAWERPLRRLCARHDLVVVEVVDPRELDLPDVGAVVLVDPESGRTREVWTSRPGLRESYALAARRHRAQVAEALRSGGAGHVVLRTDRDWVADLARYVLARRRTPRAARRGVLR